MKKTIVTFVIGISICLCAYSQKKEFPINKQEAIKAVFNKNIGLGIPGLSIALYSPSTGYWSYASGLSNIEKKEELTVNHKHYLQSLSKTYMAVIILKLYENGKIDLNAPITEYLDYKWLNSIKDSNKVTVKMLLNHTSGMPEYSTNALMVSRIIQDPLTVLSVPEMLSYIQGKPLEYEPGTKYVYRNTNYGLLSLIADKITGNHESFMQKVIFNKLKLDNTTYLTQENHQSNLNLTDAYWDVLLEGIPVNISKLQRANVASMRGDDGLVATTKDAVNFMKGLVEGKLLKPKTLDLMQEWVTDEKGQKRYGLGITYYDLDVTYALGHSGGGVGAGCVLLYLPELNTVVFLATNFNTMMESPIRKKAENLQMEVLMALFSD